MTDMPDLQFCSLPDHRKLAWREWGSGKPLVMLHGWSMSSVVFSEVAQQLATNFRVLCPDLPGHGFSDPVSECSLGSFVETLNLWVSQVGLQEISLLGWSFGGQLAIQAVADDLLAVEKLLLVATTPLFCQQEDWQHGLPKTQVRALERNIARAYEKTMGDFFALQFVDEDLPRERYRQILAFAVRSGRLPEPVIAKKTLAMLSRADLRNRLSDIKQPTLITHGRSDQIIPYAAGEYLLNHLPQADLHGLAQIGHAPFFSRPHECIVRWREFLQ